MNSTLVFTTSTESHRRAVEDRRRRAEHTERVNRMINAADDAAYRDNHRTVTGKCTACGSVEVLLDAVAGTTDLSSIGESATYPTGYGCEACA